MENRSSRCIGIERKSSIETEPRTLNINQLQFAREAALYVMKTRNLEEAHSIFTEGLEVTPKNVMSSKEGDFVLDSDEEDDFIEDDGIHIPELRDIVTAPF